MPRILRAQIREFLHDYRKRIFELEHTEALVQERYEQARHIVEELLDQKFHYHLHQKVDADRAEAIQLIHNYCCEAILPPIIERLAARLLLLEQRHQIALDMVTRMLDRFAEEVESEPTPPK